MTTTRRGRRGPYRRRLACLGAVAAVLLVPVLAACQGDDPPPDEPSGGASAKPVKLTLGVWGNDAEVRSYQRMVDDYNDDAQAVTVDIESWPTSSALLDAVDSGEARLDLYLVQRRNLKSVFDQGLNVPLLDLLDARGVEYGDGYAREALLAFTADDDLQCMPYDSSPMVVYYNTDLVDFDDMRERGLPVPPEDEELAWTLESFQAAAEYAARPRAGTAGLYVEPTLRGLAPFIYSGGGEVFDDDADPTSLAFSDDDTREALTRSLEVLRDPQLTLSDQQLAEATPLEWFERGKLGMITGYRDLTPELRTVKGLDFDVISMPVLDDLATVGDISGLCIAADSDYVAQSADFLVHAIGDEATSMVSRAGYLVPANLQVALSEDFLQPGRDPEHAEVFTSSLRDLRLPPLLDDWDRLDRVVQPALDELLTAPVADVDLLTEQIDELSRSVLDPDYSPSPSDGSTSPSEESSDEPSDDSSRGSSGGGS